MKRLKLFLLLLLLFLLEGTVLPILIPSPLRNDLWIHPHLVLILVVYISLYLGSKEGLLFGAVFGLFYDIAFGSIFGLNLFIYTLLGSMIHNVTGILHHNLWLALTMSGIASLSLDLWLYGFHALFLLTDISPSYLFLREAFPNVLVNMGFALAVYPWVIRSSLFTVEELQDEERGI
ncbi:putative Rod shape-determining protein MreD [[Clostridium] ultunense Esp]|nr:putative Rod shape-determining protein MreD [[Clostridium] ultunense Esp]